MSRLLVIIGITGTQGSSVYNVFKHEPGWRIRGITRDPSKHQTLEQEGVELVKADLDDQASIEAAFSGANAIFAMTDCFTYLFNDPSVFELAEKEGRHPFDVAAEREMKNAKSIIRAASKQLATLDRLVFSTLADARKWSNGEIMNLYHFNSTAEATNYLKQEFSELAERTSYLQMGVFFSNWKFLQDVMFKKQDDGSMLIRYLVPKNGKPQPWVDAPNDTGHFVRALLLSDQAPAGTLMNGYRGEPITIEQYAALWGKVNNKRVEYRQFTSEEAVGCGLPKWLAEEWLVGGKYQAKFGCDGGNPEVREPAQCGVDVERLGSVEDWMRSEDWSAVL